MGTPQKSVGRLLESPYARHLQQYPSQSEEFIPNEFGGKNLVSSSTPFKQQHQGNNYRQHLIDRRRSNNRYLNTNRGETNNYCGNNTKGVWGNRNCQNNFNPQQTQRHSNISNRLPFHGQEINQSESSFTNNYHYYHPSMLDDPWKELIDRHQAIKNSYINAQCTITEEQQYEQSHDEKPL